MFLLEGIKLRLSRCHGIFCRIQHRSKLLQGALQVSAYLCHLNVDEILSHNIRDSSCLLGITRLHANLDDACTIQWRGAYLCLELINSHVFQLLRGRLQNNIVGDKERIGHCLSLVGINSTTTSCLVHLDQCACLIDRLE